MSVPETLLVANRGEIACRVIRTAKAMGIRTVAVYSSIDRNALHVSMADEAVCIGDAPAKDSYLRIDRIIDACQSTGANAVHPGYGFLSENAAFARACADANITFIGPTPSAIEAMGSKSAAKTLMGDAGVPLIPGYHGEDQSDQCLREAADSLGYPVLLKAAAGGGGKGMRLVNQPGDFDEALASARRESMASFNDEKMLVEKYLRAPRHVEIQVFCDHHGGAVYLFERDCSVQRRHQKVLEEAPAPGMTFEVRERMGKAAVTAARAIDYRGAGTVEFLLDADGEFYFMEMNTRLQVEHPVTEMITGQDLVEWQIRVANEEPLPLQQSDLKINGHAIEARIYAEDPANGFLPATGTLHRYQPPGQKPGLRIDSGVSEGDVVSMYYDPMIAKLICHAASRDQACRALADALANFHIQGLPTNRTFLYDLVTSQPFMNAELETGFIDTHEQILFHGQGHDRAERLALAALYVLLVQAAEQFNAGSRNDRSSPWGSLSAWRLNLPAKHRFTLSLEGEACPVLVLEEGHNGQRRFKVTADGRDMRVHGRLCDESQKNQEIGRLLAQVNETSYVIVTESSHGSHTLYMSDGAMQFSVVGPDLGEEHAADESAVFSAPMNGMVVKCLVEPGTACKQGQGLMVIEAMKMEHTIRAPAPGVVAKFRFRPGDSVSFGDALLDYEFENT